MQKFNWLVLISGIIVGIMLGVGGTLISLNQQLIKTQKRLISQQKEILALSPEIAALKRDIQEIERNFTSNRQVHDAVGKSSSNAKLLAKQSEQSSSDTGRVTRKYKLSYKLSDGWEKWDPEICKRIIDAIDSAVALYNKEGEFDKVVTANYSPNIPTTDGNYNGWLNFGGMINKRVALHEISHTLGVGQHENWDKLINDGKWTGEYALAQLHEFDGPDAVLYADRQHFWPYGLSYDRESSEENDRRHVKMVAALRRDMGIVNGQ